MTDAVPGARDTRALNLTVLRSKSPGRFFAGRPPPNRKGTPATEQY